MPDDHRRFYDLQRDWHGHADATTVRAAHQRREAYLDWYLRGWLPADRSSRILDVGCGAGQLVHFLRQRGYSSAHGIDVDERQVALARELGLDCSVGDASDRVQEDAGQLSMVAILDVLEHLHPEEMHRLLAGVAKALRPDGRLVISVPNAESPAGLAARYGDITHLTAFTVASMEMLLRCHGLKISATRDPFPAPVGAARTVYRGVATAMRSVEALRLRLLGLPVPGIWSPVFWCLAVRA